MPTVIVVEDEADLRDSMGAFLAESGFDVRCAAAAAEFDALWADRPADILILDINLPGEDGLSIAERVRRESSVGIIMLTARARADDRVVGFETGADNYLVKPVSMRELTAAVKGLARRLTAGEATLPAWGFDALNWRLVAPNRHPVALTAAEFTLLSTLVATPGVSVSVDDIMAALGKAAIETNRPSLDSVLSRLRRKVADECGLALPVRSVRAVGYVFAGPVANLG